MASWNSVPLYILYSVLGWIAFVCWSVSFYPQLLLNYRRKSVVGLNFDFALLNWTKQLFYLVYNASVLFSPTVQKQYFQKYRNDEILPVAVNDLAFSIHAVLMSGLTMVQIAIYDRGNQKFSKIVIGIIILSCLAGAVCVCIAIPRHSWFWLLSCFNTMQFVLTVIKYIPQAVLNFQRKSTTGFSIGNVLLDFIGAVANCLQMLVHSIDQKTLDNIKGNLGKTLLALVSVFFTVIFIIQHYVLYPTKKAGSSASGVATVELQRDIEAS